ncbi:MAG: hypothetical protein ACREFB_19015 [Stellaceae bacterium]
MKIVGVLREFDPVLGIGVVRCDNLETRVYLADLAAAGIAEPQVGTRLLYEVAAHPRLGVTCAQQIEAL